MAVTAPRPELYRGIDYAFFPHPSVAAIKAAHLSFVGRYVSSFAPNDANGKNLIPSECHSLLTGGVSIILFVEEGANRMLGGHAAGVADAQHFDAVVKALGMPTIPGYFAADFDATPGEQTAIDAYLDGAKSVIGLPRVGLYGDFYVVSRAQAAGKCSYVCQTIAWSGSQWDQKDNVQQHLQISVGGVSVDIDGATTHDYGQWPRPAIPVTPTPHPTAALYGDGHTTLHQLAIKYGTTPQAILAATAKHDNGFPAPRVAAYVNGGNWNAALPGPGGTFTTGAGPIWIS